MKTIDAPKGLDSPVWAHIAKKYLVTQATSVASERVFSTAGDIVCAQRSCLKSEKVDMLLFLKKNLVILIA